MSTHQTAKRLKQNKYLAFRGRHSAVYRAAVIHRYRLKKCQQRRPIKSSTTFFFFWGGRGLLMQLSCVSQHLRLATLGVFHKLTVTKREWGLLMIKREVVWSCDMILFPLACHCPPSHCNWTKHTHARTNTHCTSLPFCQGITLWCYTLAGRSIYKLLFCLLKKSVPLW